MAAHGFNPLVPAGVEPARADAIERSHCGTLSAAQAGRMAAAQIARDQYRARLVEAHAPRGPVLLAGDGHVRLDVGVPHWLRPDARERTAAIGMLDEGDFTADEAGAAHDHGLTTPNKARCPSFNSRTDVPASKWLHHSKPACSNRIGTR